MNTKKTKITVRFVVEQDFEVEVRDPKLGLGGWPCIGDNMVCYGDDVHDLTTTDNIFNNPVSDIRPVDENWIASNLYNLGLGNEYTQPWLLEGEKDKDPYDDDDDEELDVEVDLENNVERKLKLVIDNDNEA